MVKLAHDLDDGDYSFESLYGRQRPQATPAFQAPARRAA